MDRVVLKISAKNQISGHIGIIFIAYLISGLISGALSAIPAVGGILGFASAVLLEFGVLLMLYDIISGITPGIARVFDGLKVYNRLNIVLTNFIAAVFVSLWSLLFVIPGIIKAISYSMISYIMIENPDVQPMDAINESKRMMQGHKMDYFVLMLSFFPWILLTIITFGIAGIYVVPYVETTMFNFYYSIKGE